MPLYCQCLLWRATFDGDAMESGEVFTIFGELWNNIDQSQSFWFYKPCQNLRSTPYKVNLTFSLSSGFALKYINVLFHNFFPFRFLSLFLFAPFFSWQNFQITAEVNLMIRVAFCYTSQVGFQARTWQRGVLPQNFWTTIFSPFIFLLYFYL